MIWIGPEDTPQTWALQVTAADPWNMPAVTVHRGLGGGTQVVWSAAPADAGQRLTARCAAAEVPDLLTLLATPQRVVISTDDDSCAVLPGVGVITRVDVTYDYQVSPAAAEATMEVTAV